MAKLYSQNEQSIEIIDRRAALHFEMTWHYITDLYTNLIGIEGLGLYQVLCRLARPIVDSEGKAASMGLHKLARKVRKGYEPMVKLIQLLADCQFIEFYPSKKDAQLGWTRPRFVILDPPIAIDQTLLHKYAPPSGYDPLCEWLVDSPNRSDASPIEPTLVLPETSPLSYVGQAPVLAKISPSPKQDDIEYLSPKPSTKPKRKKKEIPSANADSPVSPKPESSESEKQESDSDEKVWNPKSMAQAYLKVYQYYYQQFTGGVTALETLEAFHRKEAEALAKHEAHITVKELGTYIKWVIDTGKMKEFVEKTTKDFADFRKLNAGVISYVIDNLRSKDYSSGNTVNNSSSAPQKGRYGGDLS